MVETSARLLRLLTLLQTRREWASAELATRLGVAVRTVRRDVERLRSLDYPIDSAPGVSGGYRLRSGSAMPPLMLDDDEAVAVAVGLRTAADGSVTGIEETSLRALVKIEQVLPARLRHRVNAVQSHLVHAPGRGPTVDADVLTAITSACRDLQRLRFDYLGHDGTESRREVEPHRLVNVGRRWYLVAWDVDRGDWRTFRADRISPRIPTGPRFTTRALPDDDLARYVTRGAGAALWRYRARVFLHAPADMVAAKLPPTVVVDPVDGDSCLIDVGADSFDVLLAYLAMLDVDFEVVEPAELVDHLRSLAARYTRAADGAV